MPLFALRFDTDTVKSTPTPSDDDSGTLRAVLLKKCSREA